MHTHFGALLAWGAWLSILLTGTLWRLIAGYFVRSNNPTMQHLGGAMAFQY